MGDKQDTLIRDMPIELVKKIDRIAEREKRSRNAEMLVLLERAVEHESPA